MKKLLLATLFTACSSLAFVSCNNGAYDANPNTDFGSIGNPFDNGTIGGSIYMTAKINGVPFNAAYGSYDKKLGLALYGVFPEREIQMFLFNYSGPQLYTIDGNTVSALFKSGANPITTIAADSGGVMVTSEAGNVVQGTFGFSKGNFRVTDGVFYLVKQ